MGAMLRPVNSDTKNTKLRTQRKRANTAGKGPTKTSRVSTGTDTRVGKPPRFWRPQKFWRLIVQVTQHMSCVTSTRDPSLCTCCSKPVRTHSLSPSTTPPHLLSPGNDACKGEQVGQRHGSRAIRIRDDVQKIDSPRKCNHMSFVFVDTPACGSSESSPSTLNNSWTNTTGRVAEPTPCPSKRSQTTSKHPLSPSTHFIKPFICCTSNGCE